MKILKKPNNSHNYIATVAIGKEHFNTWEKYVLPSWIMYCDKYGLGLVVFEKELIEKSHPKWKKSNWQRLLMGTHLKEINVKNVLYIDTDILISPFSPNVFDYHDEDKISVVSITKTPFDHLMARRKIAFLRNRYLSSDYPLDSSLFISKDKYYKYHGFDPKDDIFCSGFFIFNVNAFSDIFSEIFFKYASDTHTLTNGGDEPIINFEFQNYKINWLDYKFQALWVYEISEKYPFLYQDMSNKELVKKCIQASLRQNYFLHFSGKWESDVYKNKNIIDNDFLAESQDFNHYLKTPVTGKPVGPIYPKK